MQIPLKQNQEDRLIHTHIKRTLNIVEINFVSFARKDDNTNQNLSLRCRAARETVRAIDVCVYDFADLRNRIMKKVHVSQLKFCDVRSLGHKVIVSHMVESKAGITVYRLMSLQGTDSMLSVLFR